MLELTIIDGLDPENPTLRTKIFIADGGVIGRDAACDWVLFDRKRIISGQHAKIIFVQGQYHLSDVSTNGVLDRSGSAIQKAVLKKLQLGDIYMIGPYRIEVSKLQVSEHEAFRNSDLAHLLEDFDSTAFIPLDNAKQSKLNQQESFSLPTLSNTLKAYDFMPEPLDYLLTAKPVLPRHESSNLLELQQKLIPLLENLQTLLAKLRECMELITKK